MDGFAGLPDDVVRRLLDRLLSRGATDADVFFEDVTYTTIMMEDGILRNVVMSEDGGVGLRAVAGDAQAFGFVQVADEQVLLQSAAELSVIANSGRGGVVGDISRVLGNKGLYTGETSSVAVPPKSKIDMLVEAESAARAFSPDVKRVEVSLSEELRRVRVVRADGRDWADVLPMMILSVTVVAERNGLKQRGYSSGGGREGLEYFARRSAADIGREAARLAVAMMDAKPAPAGPQTVVLAPGDSGVLLHEAVGHGLEGDFNRKGTSKYSGKVGTKVASELCTIVDDGTIPLSRGSISADDEACESKYNVLIENGTLKGYMHDSISAKAMGVPLTGNGRRQSYRYPPMPRMTNTYMLSGKHDPEEVIASVDSGIYCKTFAGGQVNISNGDFVFQVVEAYAIDKGKIASPLKDVVIIGNGPDALGKVVMVGNDLKQSDGRWTCGKEDQRVPVGVGIPTVRIDGITVGGTK